LVRRFFSQNHDSLADKKMSTTLNQQITLDEAIELTTRYRNNPGADLPLCETYELASVQALLNQPGSHAFRIYLGRKADNSICSVLVAADAEGRDILPPSGSLLKDDPDDDGIILENAQRCPPACPPESPLNG
jgi:hypothetical protein